MQYLIGIDIGTTNTKAIAYTSDGDIVSSFNLSYSPLSTEPGWHELDPDILFNATLDCCEQVLQEMKKEGSPKGISFSSAMHGVIMIGPDDKPLTSMITWADLRSSKYAKELRGTTQGIDIYNRTGTPVHPMSPLCKIMWMRDNMPDVFSKTKMIISIKEYIFKKLFDKYIVDYSIASATGLFDIDNKIWYQPSIDIAGIRKEQLSEAVSPTYSINGLKQEYALKLGIDKDIPFIIGASDGCLANLGSNAVNPGDVSLTIGTSGAVRMLTKTPQKDARRRLFNYLLTDELYVSGGPINNGGVLLKWYAENFLDREFTGAADFEWFLQEAVQVPPGSEGLIFLPYVQGERAPVWDADAKGVFFGIHSGHTRAHFMRAIIEGICFALYEVGGSLEEVIAPIENIYASGGFIQSKEWLQILTDVFAKRISITDTADASAVGAAILGMKAIGMINDISEFASKQEIKEIFEPDMQKHELYKRNYSVYSSLYEKLKEEFSKLST